MKFIVTVSLFRGDTLEGQTELLCEFDNPINAIRAIAQMGCDNSPVRAHPAVQAFLTDVPESALARLRQRQREGTTVLVTDVREYRPQMPEELRRNPNLLHVLAARPRKKVPPEGLIRTPEEEDGDPSIH